MTYDCFPFFNELDILEIRLNVLNDVVDKFVICEAPWTYSGMPKPLIFQENRDRYKKFSDKIVHIIAEDPPPYAPRDEHNNPPARQLAWVRENWQRNQLVRGLKDAKEDDVILLSDLDEIPNPAVIAGLGTPVGVVRFGMRFYNFFLNYRNYSVPNWPLGTQACTVATFRNELTYEGMVPDQFVLEAINVGATLSKLRMAPTSRVIKDAGWHFSYCGGAAAVRTKFQSFAHTELNIAKFTDLDEIEKAMKRGGKSAACRGYSFFAETIDESFPQYIRDNINRYPTFVLPVDEIYLRRTRIPRAWAWTKGCLYRLMVKMIPSFLVPLALRVRCFIFRLRTGCG